MVSIYVAGSRFPSGGGPGACYTVPAVGLRARFPATNLSPLVDSPLAGFFVRLCAWHDADAADSGL